jgi:hypothetical protein
MAHPTGVRDQLRFALFYVAGNAVHGKFLMGIMIKAIQ